MSSTIANKKQKYTKALAAIVMFEAQWPKAFAVREVKRRPLQIGIDQAILAQLNGTLQPHEVTNALRVYVSSASYLKRMYVGAVRIDLNGGAAGTVTIEAAQKAAEELANRLLKADARRKARKAEERPTCSGGSAGGTVSVKPKRLGLADLRQLALARKAVAR
jgi:ProP effector